MEINFEGMDFEDILANAVLSEEDASAFYSEIAKRLPEGITKNKFNFLSEQEKSHKKIMESLYLEIFGTKEIKKPKRRFAFECSEKTIKELGEVSTLIEVIEIAMGCEKKAEITYRYLMKKSNKGYVKNTFRYIAETEHSHYVALKTEYSYLTDIGKEPEKYSRTLNLLNIVFKF